MTNPAVAVHGLTKIFSVPFHRQSIVAVKELNLRIEPGEVYGLLGPNGSGKSTTLKIILGLVSPTRGRTEIFGCDSRLVQSREAVGFLPENPYFYKYLTGKETLPFFWASLRTERRKTEESRERITRPCRAKQSAQPPAGDLFQRDVATHWSCAGTDSRSQAGGAGRADGRRRSGRLARDSRFDPRPEAAWDHRAAFIAFARASAGNLRP